MLPRDTSVSNATAATTIPHDISSSPLMTIRQTPNAGRGVFAICKISAGTPLLTSPSPAAHVVFREYRREVCGECFAYDRGVTWKLRDARTGLVFCTATCKEAWHARYSAHPAAVEAMAAVENLASKARGSSDGHDDTDMLDVTGSRPSESDIREAWKAAEESGALIRAFRCKEEESNGTRKANKLERKAMRAALDAPTAPDVLSYLMCAVLAAQCAPEQWADVLELHAASNPHAALAILNQHTLAYRQLLAIVPAALLPSVSPSVLVAASTREWYNSFGLRSLDDGGSEMFGFGIWPSASYWNHSCAPNVSKSRIGRSWLFEASRDIEEGSELCITYLGGDERELDLDSRRSRLSDNWGFVCACQKCSSESSPTVQL